MSRQLHASEVGGERGPELRSAPEQSPLEEFLATAELAGTRFVAGEGPGPGLRLGLGRGPVPGGGGRTLGLGRGSGAGDPGGVPGPVPGWGSGVRSGAGSGVGWVRDEGPGGGVLSRGWGQQGRGGAAGASGEGDRQGWGQLALGDRLSLPAERLNIQIVSAQSRTGLLTAQEAQRVRQLHEENRQLLRIPRR